MKEAKTAMRLRGRNSRCFHIPESIRFDERFPFKDKAENLTMRIIGKKIIIE